MDKQIAQKLIYYGALPLCALLLAVGMKFAGILAVGLLIAAVLGVLLFLAVARRPALGPIWIMLALPFERLLTVDVGFTVKPIHGVIAVVLLAWLYLFITGHIKLRYPLITWLAALFWLVGLWSYSVSIDPSRTLLILAFWLIALMGFWLTVQFVQTKEDIKSIAVLLIVIAIILVIFGFYQFIGNIVGLPNSITGIRPGYDKTTFGFPRIHATFPEPLYFADYLFVPFYLAVAYFLYGGIKGKLSRLWALVASLLMLVGIILTVARGAYIALVVSGLVLVVWQYRRFFQLKNIIVVLSIFALSAVLVLGFLTFSEPRAKDAFLAHVQVDDRTKGESVVARVQASQRALDAWDHFPILGIGLGGYGPWELQDRGEVHIVDADPIVNNQYLETLAETGTVGFVVLLLIIITLLWRSIRAWLSTNDPFLRATLSGLTIGVLAIFIQYATFSTIYIIYIWVFIGLLVATQEIIFRSSLKEEKN